MFHKSNMGLFGDNLPHDIDGFVPEAGDKREDFNFDDGADFVEPGDYVIETWEQLVKAAVEATAKASTALEEWRAEG